MPDVNLVPTKNVTKTGRGRRTLPPWLVPGNPGHRGARDPKTNEIAALCRSHVKRNAIPMLVAIIEDDDKPVGTRIKAAEVLGRWAGMETSPQVTLNDNREQAPRAQIIYLPRLGTKDTFPLSDNFSPG